MSTPHDRARQLRGAYEAGGVAAHYAGARWQASRHARRTDRRERAIVLSFLARSGPLDRILDVPCGASRMLATLAGAESGEPHRVIAVDVAAAMLAAARTTAADGAAPWLLQASATRLPLAHGCVDLVLCMRLLHHFASPSERVHVLAELARVTRRYVITSYFDAASLQAWRGRVLRKRRRRFVQPARAFAAEAHAAGLRIVARRWVLRHVSEQVLVLLETRN